MDTKDTPIKHVSDFIKMIEDQSEGFINQHSFLYRGEGNTNYKLIPSVYRTYQNCDSIYDMYLERQTEQSILQQFMTEAASYINNLTFDDRFIWVECAQHYGVPTRLLDWTENPLVALFFACICSNDYSEKIPDGKVYILNNSIYKQICSRNDKNKMDNKIIKNEAEKMIWGKQDTFPYPITFRPYYFDKRMAAQQSCFMVWGYERKPLDELIIELEKDGKGSVLREVQTSINGFSMISHEDTALTSCIIPGEYRLQLIDELDSIGINKATLFPGLDGIGAAIERRLNIKYRDPIL